MAALTFIRDMLLAVNSPVLYDIRVNNEVRELERAFAAVKKFPQPQYFRIRGPPREYKLLERSRFPILIAVAQRLRMELYTTVTQFVTTMPINSSVVDSLVRLHKSWVSVIETEAHRRAVTTRSD